MARSRKDQRGYALHTGEYQRADGRYTYSYMGWDKKRHYLYAKSLKELRQKERKIRMDMDNGINPGAADRITLNELYDRYLEQKYDLKPTTKTNYKYMYDHFVRQTFGKRMIGSIKYSDIKVFYYSLILEKGLQANTLDNVHTQIHPALQMAVRDGLLVRNASDGIMKEIKKSHVWPKTTRRALTKAEQDAYMNYIKTHQEWTGWLSLFTVLMGTGMRIGECLALRWSDLDMENRIITVNLSFVNRQHGKGHSERHISTPKTSAGIRTIPMIDEVYEAFLDLYEFQSLIGFNVEEIDGYRGFVFSNARGNVYSPPSVNRAIERIRLAYNKEEEEKAAEENRTPFLIPHFSAHCLRHTFCTRLVENEVSLAVVREIMGHRDLSTTLEVYTTVTDDKKKESLSNLKIKIV